MNLFNAINEAIKCDKLEEAVLIVQEAIGQTDGLTASIFFSDESQLEWDAFATWERKELLSDYIAYEINNS